MSATPLLTRLDALRAELTACARVASADNNNEAALAFAAARDRLEEVVAGYVAENRVAFFDPASSGGLSWGMHPVMTPENTRHGPN